MASAIVLLWVGGVLLATWGLGALVARLLTEPGRREPIDPEAEEPFGAGREP